MKSFAIVLAVLAGVESCCPAPRQEPLAEAIEQLVVAMGDSRLSASEREAVRFMLLEGSSKRMIPVLIDHLSDGRVFDPKAVGPNGDASGQDTYVETVGMACERTLYDILLDRHLRNEFLVKDWKQWWEANKTKSMGEICDQAKAKNGTRTEKR